MLVFDWSTIFGILALGQTFIVGVYLVWVARRNLALWTMAIGLFTLLIAIMHDVLLHSKLALQIPQFTGYGPFAAFFIGPLILLLSVKILWPGKVISKWQLVHFLPFVVHQWSQFSTYAATNAAKVAFLEAYYAAPEVYAAAPELSIAALLNSAWFYGHRLVYITASIWMLSRHKQEIQYGLQARKYMYTAVRLALYGYCVMWLVVQALTYIPATSLWMSGNRLNINLIALSLVVTSIAILAVRFDIKDVFSSRSTKKYANSYIDDSTAENLLLKIEEYVVTDEQFRNGDLRQPDVAKAIGLSPQLISQTINSQTGMTFNQYVNHHRINAIKSLLSAPENEDTDIMNLAYDVGFSSKQTFNRVFKEVAGVTPTQFRQNQRP